VCKRYSKGIHKQITICQKTMTVADSDILENPGRTVSRLWASGLRGMVRILVAGGNESVYVLAGCWRTLSPSSCRACLDNVSCRLQKETKTMYPN
ncbi:hypothetical protein M8C21_015814, partial [Ambrosia artemisiifolia]